MQKTTLFQDRFPVVPVSSTAHDLWAGNVPRGVTGVDHQLRFLDDVAVIIVGMVGYDNDAVVLRKVLQLGTLHLQVVLTALANEREVRIVVADLSSILLQ